MHSTHYKSVTVGGASVGVASNRVNAAAPAITPMKVFPFTDIGFLLAPTFLHRRRRTATDPPPPHFGRMKGYGIRLRNARSWLGSGILGISEVGLP